MHSYSIMTSLQRVYYMYITKNEHTLANVNGEIKFYN